MTERANGYEPVQEWPVIQRPNDEALLEGLARKRDEYEGRFFAGSEHRYTSLILQKDYYESYAQSPLEKTDAFVKWLLTGELLATGEVDTAEFREALTGPGMEEYFISFRRNDNEAALEKLILRAAHVVKQYATYGRPIVFKSQILPLPHPENDA
jgi:hypothetical protein